MLGVVQSNRANPAAVHQDSWTAIMYAADNGHLGMMECLLAHGADVNVQSYVRIAHRSTSSPPMLSRS